MVSLILINAREEAYELSVQFHLCSPPGFKLQANKPVVHINIHTKEGDMQGGSILGATLDFAEASQRFQSRGPRSRGPRGR